MLDEFYPEEASLTYVEDFHQKTKVPDHNMITPNGALQLSMLPLCHALSYGKPNKIKAFRAQKKPIFDEADIFIDPVKNGLLKRDTIIDQGLQRLRERPLTEWLLGMTPK